MLNKDQETFAARTRAAKERFVKLLPDARREQERLLQRFVGGNAGTVFGREYGFSAIRTLEDYRRAVPVRAYEDLSPWIQRSMAGEARVLTESTPMLFFMTTGTTGVPKHVPVTNEFFTRWRQNTLIFWANVLEHSPEVLARDDTILMLHLAPKPYSKWAREGVPIHHSTEMPALGRGALPSSRAPWFPPPAELTDAERLYYLLRCSVESPLVGIVCLHSSRLQAAASLLAREAPRIVKEVREGTVMGKAERPANAARAAELERLLSDGPLTPSRVWPTLRFISCWVGASFDLFRADIDRSFGVELIPQMVASSEVGHMTMPLEPGPVDGPLTIHTNVYEFIAVDESGAASTDRTLGFDELERGQVYEIVVTTCSGLYRYASGDRFRVRDFVEGVPRLDFLGRGGASDLTGEKVTEHHATAALQEGLRRSGLEAASATLCAVWGRPCHYVALVEPGAAWSADGARQLPQRLDEALQEQAPRYKLKRGFGDLGPLMVKVVREGTFARYRQRRAGAGPGQQIKDRVLHHHYESGVIATLEELSSGRS